MTWLTVAMQQTTTDMFLWS